MRRLSACLALLIALALALAPAGADARAGSGASFGSRGSRTYAAPSSTATSPYGAAPFQRSTTVPGSSSYGGSSYGGGYGYGRSGFGAGLAGGLLGFGLGSMLFGHRGYGYGYGGFGGGLGILGLLIRLALIFFVVRWLYRMFARRNGGSLFVPSPAVSMGYGMPAAGATPMLSPPLALQVADYQAFEVLLKNVQAAWSNNDITGLQSFASPEMVSYFADQLAGNASRGVRNVVRDIHLQKGDLSEAWSENGRDYATVAMRYSMIDSTYDQSGQLVDGSASEHTTVTEYWTFLRSPGGRWMLSGIQQAA